MRKFMMQCLQSQKSSGDNLKSQRRHQQAEANKQHLSETASFRRRGSDEAFGSTLACQPCPLPRLRSTLSCGQGQLRCPKPEIMWRVCLERAVGEKRPRRMKATGLRRVLESTQYKSRWGHAS